MSVTVELTESQARALVYLTAKVSGPQCGPRGSIVSAGRAIARALGEPEWDGQGYYDASREYVWKYGYTGLGTVSFSVDNKEVWPL